MPPHLSPPHTGGTNRNPREEQLHCGETNSFDGRGAVDGANRVDGIPLEEPIVGEPASFQRVVLWHSSLETELRPQSA